MDTYMAAWKTFRRISDENRATAEHLVCRGRWPRRDALAVVDVGCGDGRLLEEVLLRSTSRIDEAQLIDPDLDLLNEAANTIQQTGLVQRAVRIHGGAEECFAREAKNADVILLVHVVYLLEPGVLEHLIGECPPNVPLYVVLDATDSVFTALWERTAPKYHARALAAHETIRALPRERYQIEQSVIASTIADPLANPRRDVRDSLLSILSYSSVSPATPADLREWIESTLRERTEQGVVRCASSCYEIVRRSA